MMKAVKVHGFMAVNVLKSTCRGARTKFNFGKDGNNSIQKLTKRNSLFLKTDMLKNF